MPDQKTPHLKITVQALLETKSLSDITSHPDGKRFAYVVTEADFIDRFIANRGSMAVIEEEMRHAGMTWTVRQFASYVLAGFAVGIVAAFWCRIVAH